MTSCARHLASAAAASKATEMGAPVGGVVDFAVASCKRKRDVEESENSDDEAAGLDQAVTAGTRPRHQYMFGKRNMHVCDAALGFLHSTCMTAAVLQTISVED